MKTKTRPRRRVSRRLRRPVAAEPETLVQRHRAHRQYHGEHRDEKQDHLSSLPIAPPRFDVPHQSHSPMSLSMLAAFATGRSTRCTLHDSMSQSPPDA